MILPNTKPRVFSVAQLGARMHYAVPRILHGAGALEQLYTDVYASRGVGRIISSTSFMRRLSYVRKLEGRVAEDVPVSLVTSFGMVGLQFWLKMMRARTEAERLRNYLWVENAFGKAIAKNGFGQSTAIYGFNSASAGIFRRAKAQGLTTVLEQTIAPKRVEVELLNRFGEGARGPSPAPPELADFFNLETEEWALADVIVCASDFVRDGLIKCGVPSTKCRVVPYGVDLSHFRRQFRIQPAPSARMRVLFVGGVSYRKGIRYLFEAMQKLRGANIECRVIGPMVEDSRELAKICPPNVHLAGSVPRADIASEMHKADVFCLPSLCEGSATVTYEALAAGLPIVATPNAGSIVRDRIDGLMVSAGDSDGLAAALLSLAQDRELRKNMAINALQRSSLGSLSAYQDRLLSMLEVTQVRS